MRIGYSFWGFLGPGILDTPDGGRSHRRTLIDGLLAAGHEVVFLQANRDLHEAGLDLRDDYTWRDGLPRIDALFLEWRWPILGRNTTPCGTAGHTCDLHRQQELLGHYTLGRATPTLLWDKDRQLSSGDPLREHHCVAVCEPALRPSPGVASLLFPVAETALHQADPAALAVLPRPLPLVYVGNQYDRDEAFIAYFAPAARHLRHRVAGKWTHTTAWPHVNFTGRCAFTDVAPLYRSALATVTLLPARYARAGQMTQRLFEAVLAGCLPLVPAEIGCADRFVPVALHVRDGADVLARVRHLTDLAGTPARAELIADCIRHLDLFRLSRQVVTINETLERLREAVPRLGDNPPRLPRPVARRR